MREIEESMPFVSSHIVKNEWVGFRKRGKAQNVGGNMPSLWSVSEKTKDRKEVLEEP